MNLSLLQPAAPTCLACRRTTKSGTVTPALSENPGVTHPGVPSLWISDSLPPSEEAPALCFLGMNPGFHEDRANEPFVGRSGLRLRGGRLPNGTWAPGPYIDATSLRTRSSIYLLNAARCYTPVGEPKASHYKACLPYTMQDLDAISSHHPRTLLVTLGAWPARLLWPKALASLSKAFSHPATPHPTLRHTFLFATYHPAYLLRVPGKKYAVLDHMQIVSSFLAGTLAPRSPPRTVAPFSPAGLP